MSQIRKNFLNTWSNSKDIFKQSFILEALQEFLGGSVDRAQVGNCPGPVVLDQGLQDGLHPDGAVGDQDDVTGLEELRGHLGRVFDEFETNLRKMSKNVDFRIKLRIIKMI